MTEHTPASVLVAGSGSIGRRHVVNLLDLGVGRVIVWTARDVSAVGWATDRRIRVVQALPEDCPTVAIVANDTDRHVETARQLVSRGCHVLIEKPVAEAPTHEVDLLCREALDAGVVARVAYNLRLLGVFREIDAVLSSGDLGTPRFARIEAGQWLPAWRPDREYRDSYSAHSARGGGVGLDLSHELDYMRMLFGPPRSWQVRHSYTGALDVRAADVFDGIYAFDDGFTCTVHLDYLERRARRRMRIVGAEGFLECDLAGGMLSLETREGERTVDTPALFDVSATYRDELVAFFSEVAGESEHGCVLPTLEDGVSTLRLLANAGGGEPS